MKSLWVMLLIFLFSFSVQANENSLDRKKQSESGVKPIPEPVSFVKEFSAKFNGKKISYRAVAGETYIRGDNGKPTASFFTTAYLKNDVKQTSTRPGYFYF